MVILIIGGSGSGKSEYAENRAVELNKEGLVYIATMQPEDLEGRKRVMKHREMRKNKDFSTIECYTHLEKIEIKKNQTILLECMSNLIANEMFSKNGRKENVSEIILSGIKKLISESQHLIIVSNNVFADGKVYDELTKKYLQTIAELNRKIGEISNQVVEVVHGISIVLK